MSVILIRNWWLLALRGVAAILFGIGAFAWPSITLAVLVALFGAYALVDGIFSIVSAVRTGEQERHSWALLIEGALGVIAGLVTFVWPGITALALLLIIAFWAILTGLLEIVAAIRLRHEIRNEWLLGLSGIASLVFGLILAARPDAGVLAVIWIIGAYTLVFGVLMLALAFRLRRFLSEVEVRRHGNVPHPA
jgi:uncharacterized membrane protein HdeD (DUF308 family)